MRYVFVRDKNGLPLMPTNRFGHVRKLLRDGKAVVVCMEPFVIQLRFDTTTYTQPLTRGVDVGYKFVGLSVTGQKKEFLAIVGMLRTDVHEKMETRGMCKRSRRGRNTRHRPARFDNRHNSTKKGRTNPTTECRVAGHISLIRLVCSIAPIKRVVLENGSFDTQRIQNPKIEGEQ